MTRNRAQTTRRMTSKPANVAAQARAAPDSRADIYQRVTDRIAAAIEAGAGKWRMPWHPGADGAAPQMPVNAATGRLYRGVNTVVLWAEAQAGGLPVRDMGHLPPVAGAWGAGPQGRAVQPRRVLEDQRPGRGRGWRQRRRRGRRRRGEQLAGRQAPGVGARLHRVVVARAAGRQAGDLHGRCQGPGGSGLDARAPARRGGRVGRGHDAGPGSIGRDWAGGGRRRRPSQAPPDKAEAKRSRFGRRAASRHATQITSCYLAI